MLVTAPLAPLAAVAYFLSEWLLFITKPSPTAGLSFTAQLVVLIGSPLPYLAPLLVAQAVATLLSAVAYPRFRAVACIPAGIIFGFLGLVLLDNFTYTLFSVGVVRSGEVLRIVYAAVLLQFVAAACWRLSRWATNASARESLVAASVSTTVALALTPAFANVSSRANGPAQGGPAAEVLPTLRGSKAGANDQPNILFLGVDGVSADILSAYGYKRQTTPFLDSIKEDTLFFENAFSNSTRTHGSLVTLLTGRLPFHTRVTFPPTVLQGDDAHRTLPAMLKELRYGTLQLGMRHYADAEDTNVFGFDAANYRWQDDDEDGGEGDADEIEVFRDSVEERIDERMDRLLGKPPAPDVFAHVEGRQVAAQWRDELRVKTLVQYFKTAPRPWFIHLHLLDTHCCAWHPEQIRFSGDNLTTDARDSQILETDAHIRQLFEGLEAAGILDKTIVAINSDHGVEWQTKARVPLMIRFPNAARKGHVTSNVQAVDVAPTMLDVLGVKQPEWMDGQSLLQPERLNPERRIFAVSDIRPRKGVSGLRVMQDSGPPNYGASAVMMVAGSTWFELNLLTGQFQSGAVKGHTGSGFRTVPDDTARREILDFLGPTGFRLETP